MRILLSGTDTRFTAPPSHELIRLPVGDNPAELMVPNPRSVFRRWQRIRAASRPEFGPVDLVLTECFGGAYLYNRVRRGLKMFYERTLIAALIKAARNKSARLAVLDLSDELTIHPVNRPLIATCDLYFKRELALDRWRSLESFHGAWLRIPSIGYRTLHPDHAGKLMPISLGLGETEVEARKLGEEFSEPVAARKTHDILYAGKDVSRPLRQSIRSELLACRDDRISIRTPEGEIPFADFAQLIHTSWLCISPPGLGWDCYRHYEAGLFGAVPVLARPDITPHQPFVHGRDAIYYEPERPLLEQLTPWLDDKLRLLEMARAARAHVLQHHTRAARSRYVLETIQKLPLPAVDPKV